MLDYRAKALALASLGTLTIVASCDDPTLPTDLRGAGNPSVTAVMVQTAIAAAPTNLNFEAATYCKLNDEKRPGFVGSVPTVRTTQVCDDDITMPAEKDGVAPAPASTWYVRIVFDRLLDPDVESLITDEDGAVFGSLAKTQPVTLKCGGVDVAYDGFYVPNGNHLSWPLGPSLFIKPVKADSVAVDTACEVTLKSNVRGKAGEAVADDSQRAFGFKIAPLTVLAVSPKPAAKAVEIAAAQTINFTFNAKLAAPVAAAKVKMFAAPNKNAGTADEAPDDAICAAGGTAVTAGTQVGTNKTVMQMFDATAPGDNAFAPGKTYRIELEADAAATALAGGTGVVKTSAPICVFVLSE